MGIIVFVIIGIVVLLIKNPRLLPCLTSGVIIGGLIGELIGKLIDLLFAIGDDGVLKCIGVCAIIMVYICYKYIFTH